MITQPALCLAFLDTVPQAADGPKNAVTWQNRRSRVEQECTGMKFQANSFWFGAATQRQCSGVFNIILQEEFWAAVRHLIARYL